MEVILKEDVANVGKIGEVVRVRDGYARNYLLPRGLVLLANKKNLKTFEHHKKVVADQKQKITREAQSVGESIGAVSNIQIEKALKAQGLVVDRRKIHLDAPIKVAGEYEVPIRMTADLTVPLKVSVIPED
jgi:large subunit ribosomal protein L9